MTREQIEELRHKPRWTVDDEEFVLAAAERALKLEDVLREIRRAVIGYLAQRTGADELRAAIDRAEGKP